MIPRYSHPEVERLYSPLWTYRAWLQIETLALAAQQDNAVVPYDQTERLFSHLHSTAIQIDDVLAIEEIEHRTKHDVAAFLTWLRDHVEGGQWLHYGLTSSDLVDTAQAMRFKVLHGLYLSQANNLQAALGRLTSNHTPLVGMTHGQPAEPVSMCTRATAWLRLLNDPINAVAAANRQLQVMKLSGPVGTFAHNPPEVEARVADALGLVPCGRGATQITPRSSLALWASASTALAASCAKIATDLRLMNLMQEVSWQQVDGQVGSSAMAHKNNPIIAEQVCGLAQLAQGYAASLQPLSLWLERDISNSCVERVAVPDLWHVVFRVLQQTTQMLDTLELSKFWAEHNLERVANQLHVHRATLLAIADGEDFETARDFGREVDVETYDLPGDVARNFLRNYR